MAGVSDQIREIEVEEELRICPDCDYARGFHVSFLPEGDKLRVVLICPNCGARYDVHRTL